MEKNRLNSPCELLIIAGSAGSLEVLLDILPELRPDFSFAILVVLHRGNSGDSGLTELFSVKTDIPIHEVDDKDEIVPGVIYVAPKNYHILCEKNRVFSLDASEKVNFSRPSIDVSFESAALAFGPALVTVLLSGANSDGTDGFVAVREHGGITIAQDPESARIPYMPRNAITHGTADYVYDQEGLIKFINALNRGK